MGTTFLKNYKWQIILFILLGAIAWSTSITNEFVGYDDIKLIVRNDRIQKDIFYTITFYGNIVSDSHNVAWTNFPTVIYRPLEWVGSSIGYHIWGARSWCFHLFVNFSFHLLNGLLFFLILRRLFNYQAQETQSRKKQTNQDLVYEPISWWVPFVILCVWIVHPLHNEAVNMLTSGVGFLWATLFSLTGIWLNLKIQELKSLQGSLLLVCSFLCFFISYHGSEMTSIAPLVLLGIFVFRIVNKNQIKYRYEFVKLVFAFTSFVVYMLHRSSIVTEAGEWKTQNISELMERLFVLAPEIFLHYIKLFFFPLKLSMDEHHQVLLENAFTPYHLLALAIALSFVWGIWYFYSLPTNKFFIHNRIIAGSLAFTGLSIAMSLNIIPLYCLARDRYTYFFVLGLLITIIVFVDKALLQLKDQGVEIKPRSLITFLIMVILCFSLRSILKSLDWNNGEKFWTSTINSVSDIGVKQNWRYRLLQYYEDPGTSTFRPNKETQLKSYNDFLGFISDNRLDEELTARSILQKARDPVNYMKSKYSYIWNKSIASAIFFNAVVLIGRDKPKGIELYKLAHIYDPEHFQTNLQLLINLHDSEPEFCNRLLWIMESQASRNSFLAKGLMDGLFHIKHPKTYDYARLFVSKFPNTQVFHIYNFHAAYMSQDYRAAYQEAKKIIKKYHEKDNFENFIKQYELGIISSSI